MHSSCANTDHAMLNGNLSSKQKVRKRSASYRCWLSIKKKKAVTLEVNKCAEELKFKKKKTVLLWKTKATKPPCPGDIVRNQSIQHWCHFTSPDHISNVNVFEKPKPGTVKGETRTSKINTEKRKRGFRPARWVWGARVLGGWAVWRYVRPPSTRPGGAGSSPCCRRCWWRPRFVAAPPPPRCQSHSRDNSRVRKDRHARALANSQSIALSPRWDNCLKRGQLPVSIEGGVVEGGVSSAVHTIHIGASPDAVESRGGCYTSITQHTHTHTHQTNTAQPSVKSLPVGVTDCYLRSQQQPA